jgi:hypothetical protein
LAGVTSPEKTFQRHCGDEAEREKGVFSSAFFSKSPMMDVSGAFSVSLTRYSAIRARQSPTARGTRRVALSRKRKGFVL